MANQWIAVVTRTGARIYRGRSFGMVEQIENDLGREKNRAFTTERPSLARNRTAARTSTHRLPGEPRRPHDAAAVAFALKLARNLNRRLEKKEFDQLLVAAEPRMMGWLKAKMPRKLKDRTDWLAKDLAKLTVPELRTAIRGSQTWRVMENPLSNS